MPRLTKRFVEAIEPADKPTHIWDDQLSGFGVRVLPNGHRRYLVKYRTGGGGRTAPQRWYLLGTHGAITCEQARDLAQQVLAVVARGDDPQADKFAFRAAPTVTDLWQRYETDHLPHKKPTSASDDRQKWRDRIAPYLGSKKVKDISRDDIDRLHKRHADTPYQANRVIALLSKLFNLAELWGMRPDGSNPCRHIKKYAEEKRQRFLNQGELERLGDAMRDGLATQTESPHAVAALQLLLFTGARLNEILTARWEWVDFNRRVINLPDSKTGAKPLFLSETAIEVLRDLQTLATSDSPYIIRGRHKDRPMVNLAKPWARLCERASIKNARIHDLRHTAASVGVAQGMNLPVIGRLLGHSQAATTHRYAHVDIDPALAAADRIGQTIATALNRNGASPQSKEPGKCIVTAGGPE